MANGYQGPNIFGPGGLGQQALMWGAPFLAPWLGLRGAGYLASQAAASSQAAQNRDIQRLSERDIQRGLNMLGRIRGDVMPAAEQLAGDIRGISEGYYAPQAAAGRFQSAYGPVVGGYQALPGQYQADLRGLLGAYGQRAAGLGSEFERGAGAIGGAYGQRTRRAMGMLEGAGEQARADILRRSRGDLRTEQARLAERGLGSTTAMTSLALGGQESREAELGRLEESLRQQRLGTYAGLTGEALGARERLFGAGMGFRAGLTGEQLAAQQAGGQFGANLALQALAGRGGIAGAHLGYMDAATQNRIANLMGAGTLPMEYNIATGMPIADYLGSIQRIPPPQYQMPFLQRT